MRMVDSTELLRVLRDLPFRLQAFEKRIASLDPECAIGSLYSLKPLSIYL